MVEMVVQKTLQHEVMGEHEVKNRVDDEVVDVLQVDDEVVHKHEVMVEMVELLVDCEV